MFVVNVSSLQITKPSGPQLNESLVFNHFFIRISGIDLLNTHHILVVSQQIFAKIAATYDYASEVHYEKNKSKPTDIVCLFHLRVTSNTTRSMQRKNFRRKNSLLTHTEVFYHWYTTRTLGSEIPHLYCQYI